MFTKNLQLTTHIPISLSFSLYIYISLYILMHVNDILHDPCIIVHWLKTVIYSYSDIHTQRINTMLQNSSDRYCKEDHVINIEEANVNTTHRFIAFFTSITILDCAHFWSQLPVYVTYRFSHYRGQVSGQARLSNTYIFSHCN